MDNAHLFELINAPAGLDAPHLLPALALAQWTVWLVALVLAAGWIRAGRASRAELLYLVVAALFAMLIALTVSVVWPQPRPFALHLGTQHLAHADDPGLPSHHTTAIWALAFAALGTRRHGAWGFPLLALGLVVGLSRVYLGVHFPYDVAAALPVAMAGALAERLMRETLHPLQTRILDAYDRCVLAVRAALRGSGKA